MKTQEEIYDEMVKSLNWSIEYHTRKLNEEKIKLEILKK